MERFFLGAFLFLALACSPAYAHHSFASHYYSDKTISIEGEILQFDYRNPHSHLYVMVKGENGDIEKFSAEWRSPSELESMGVLKNTLKPGDHVIVIGNPGRDPHLHDLYLKSIRRPADGWKWD